MTRPSSNLRLFVAAYPPPALVAACGAALDGLDLPPHRRVPADQVHCTLLFVGDRPSSEMDDVIESVARAAAGLAPCVLRPLDLIALPERGPRRLVALRTDAPATLLEVQRRLAVRLARPSGRHRPWLPHLTLLRFRTPCRGPLPLDTDIAAAAPMPVKHVRLMRSELHPDGARHREVSSVPLGD